MTDQSLSPEQARCKQQQQEKHVFYLKENLDLDQLSSKITPLRKQPP